MTTHPANTLSLLADIGGTNTRCALADGSHVLEHTIRRYANKDFSGLETVLRQYLADEGDVDTAAACIAVAGPVRDGQATMTNLDWQIDEATLARAAKAEKVSILNDLQAQGYAIGHLKEGSVRPIIAAPDDRSNPAATALVVGVGTGFNAAPVFETASGRFVPPSESGHANLPIRTAQELGLCTYVSNAHGFPAVEDVLSGRGLERVYSYLGEEASDPRALSGKEIITAFEQDSDPRAAEAVRLFTRIFGTVCGNLSLIQLPFAGVYLVGGMSQALAPHLATAGFTDAFKDKGRFAGFMANFPVSVIEDDYAALIGSAAHINGMV